MPGSVRRVIPVLGDRFDRFRDFVFEHAARQKQTIAAVSVQSRSVRTTDGTIYQFVREPRHLDGLTFSEYLLQPGYRGGWDLVDHARARLRTAPPA